MLTSRNMMSLSLLLAVSMVFQMAPGVVLGNSSGVIPESFPRGKDWILNHPEICSPQNETKQQNLSTYRKYTCENLVTANLVNRGQTKNTIQFNSNNQEATLLFSARISYKKGFRQSVSPKITSFGPNDNMLKKFDVRNVSIGNVTIESGPNNSYNLPDDNPISAKGLKVGESYEVPASITIKNPGLEKLKSELAIVTAELEVNYNEKESVWVREDEVSETIRTNEGVTIKVSSVPTPRIGLIEGEIESTLVVPLKQPAYLEARQVRNSVEGDTRVGAIITSFQDLVTGKTILQNYPLYGELSRVKRTITGVEKGSYQGKISYQVIRGSVEMKDGEPRWSTISIDKQSKSESVRLRNPAK